MQGASIGEKSGARVLCLPATLLFIRGVYLTDTIGSISRWKEASWYPFAALPELPAVGLFTVPVLVPQKNDLVGRAHIRQIFLYNHFLNIAFSIFTLYACVHHPAETIPST